jgi:hypothetical protein
MACAHKSGPHRANVQQEAEAKIQSLENQVHQVQAIMAAYGLPTSSPGLVIAGLPKASAGIVSRYLAAGLHVRTPRGIPQRAWARIAANRRPSQKGQQAWDCVILESYLHIALQLRTSGVRTPIVFFTTNTRDYSDTSSRALHPTLVAEFNAVGLQYAVNFAMAEHLLT